LLCYCHSKDQFFAAPIDGTSFLYRFQKTSKKKEETTGTYIDENISVASSITYSVSKALGQVVVKKESSPKLSMYGVARSYLSTGSNMLKQSKDLLIQTIARKKKKKRRSLADDLTVVMPIGERRRLKILDSISSMANLLRSIRDEKKR
jgi:hypothetical protein